MIAERAARARDQLAEPGREVRRAELLPHRERLAQRRQRALRVIFGEQYGAARVAGDRAQDLAAETLREPFQLLARLVNFLLIRAA